MQAAIEELQRLIQRHYPEASFQLEPGDDPTGMKEQLHFIGYVC
jgi:hypothetical protein